MHHVLKITEHNIKTYEMKYLILFTKLADNFLNRNGEFFNVSKQKISLATKVF